jgi:hypothetical protein
MKHGLVIALAAIAALHATAASAQTIYQSTDKFDGSAVYNTERRSADLEGGSFWTSRFVNFQFAATKPVANVQAPYLVAVHTQTDDWIFISAGASLVLKLNGSEMIPLAGDGSLSSRNIGVSGTVTEDAYYAISPDLLRKIAAAQTVEFRIVGDRQTITGTWGKELLTDAAALSTQGAGLLGLRAAIAYPIDSLGRDQAPPMVFGVGYAEVPAQLAGLMKLEPRRGVLVVKVFPGSIAGNAGIVNGDVILRFGETPISNPEELQAAVSKVGHGDHVAVAIWRGAQQQNLDVNF